MAGRRWGKKNYEIKRVMKKKIKICIRRANVTSILFLAIHKYTKQNCTRRRKDTSSSKQNSDEKKVVSGIRTFFFFAIIFSLLCLQPHFLWMKQSVSFIMFCHLEVIIVKSCRRLLSVLQLFPHTLHSSQTYIHKQLILSQYFYISPSCCVALRL